MAKSQREKQRQPWWLGGAAASMAVCFTHPLDQTKYRMQVMHTKAPMLQTLSTFAARDGIPSLWTGLSASILRQSTYSTARFGLFTLLSQHFLRDDNRSTNPLSPWTTTILCAAAAGGLAGLVGNPAEVVLVRMCADGARPARDRRDYPDAARALLRIAREEGPRALFARGLGATVVRSVLMNVGQIAPYTASKRLLLERTPLGDDVRTHMLASLAAGTVATTVCAPADVLKSRVQAAASSSAAAAGRGSAPGLLQVLSQGLREEGPLFLMKGWTPAWLRLTPHTILTFVFMEKLQDLVNWRAASVTPVELKI